MSLAARADRWLEIRAGDVMSSPVAGVSAEASVREAARRMTVRGHGCLAVRDRKGRWVGVVSASDLVRSESRRRGVLLSQREYQGLWNAPSGGGGRILLERVEDVSVRDVMTPVVVFAPAGASLGYVARVMSDRKIHRVFVTRGRSLAGVVTAFDIARAVGRGTPKGDDVESQIVAEEIMSRPVATIRRDRTIREAARCMAERKVSALAVEARPGEVVGIVSASDIVRDMATRRHLLLDAKAFARLRGEEILKEKAGYVVERGDDIPVAGIMTPRVLSVPPGGTVMQAARLMSVYNIHRVFVEGRKRVVGIVTALDIARAVGRSFDVARAASAGRNA